MEANEIERKYIFFISYRMLRLAFLLFLHIFRKEKNLRHSQKVLLLSCRHIWDIKEVSFVNFLMCYFWCQSNQMRNIDFSMQNLESWQIETFWDIVDISRRDTRDKYEKWETNFCFYFIGVYERWLMIKRFHLGFLLIWHSIWSQKN